MKKYLLLFLIIFTCNVFANQATQDVLITDLISWTTTNGALHIKTNDSQKTNPASCSYTGEYILPSSAPEITQTLLISAFVSKITVRLTIFSGGCNSNRPQIVAVQLVK